MRNSDCLILKQAEKKLLLHSIRINLMMANANASRFVYMLAAQAVYNFAPIAEHIKPMSSNIDGVTVTSNMMDIYTV